MTDAEKIAAYLDGYNYARANKTAALDWARAYGDTSGNHEVPYYWRGVGILESAAGLPSRFVAGQQTIPTVTSTKPPANNLSAGVVRKAPVYQPTGGPTTTLEAPGPALAKGAPVTVSYQQTNPAPRMSLPLSSARFLELACYNRGRLIPYDEAVNLQRNEQGGLVGVLLRFFVDVRFDLLGDDPGEQREGYRLSGPSGPLARMVRQDIAAGVLNPNPRAYQLSDWVGARMRTGRIKLIGHNELLRLNLYSDGV